MILHAWICAYMRIKSVAAAGGVVNLLATVQPPKLCKTMFAMSIRMVHKLVLAFIEFT